MKTPARPRPARADPCQSGSIRPATVRDIPGIRRRAHRIWWSYYPGIVPRRQIRYMLAMMYSPANIRNEMTRLGIAYEKIFYGRRWVGFVSYGPSERRGELKLHKLYVDPAVHGRGLGALALRHVDRVAARNGFRRIVLRVNRRNRRAIACYLRNGFRKVTRQDLPIGDGFCMCDFIMARNVPRRATCGKRQGAPCAN